MEQGRGMRLDGDPVLRPHDIEIKRGHQGGDRSAGRLMAADLKPVPAWPEMVGLVDRPGREPQRLFFERRQQGQLVGRGLFLLLSAPAGQCPQHPYLLPSTRVLYIEGRCWEKHALRKRLSKKSEEM